MLHSNIPKSSRHVPAATDRQKADAVFSQWRSEPPLSPDFSLVLKDPPDPCTEQELEKVKRGCEDSQREAFAM